MKNKFAAVLTATKFASVSDLTSSRVDRTKDIIHGVSLISIGEAKGHKQFADRKTLEQMLECASQYQGGLRIGFNPETFDHGPAPLAGRIPNDTMRIKMRGKNEGQLLGDLHVYKTFSRKDYLYEIAETSPDHIGLSVEFNGVPEEIEGKRFARCDEIFAAKVVDIPAANAKGLFKAEDENKDNDAMTPDQIKELATGISTAIVSGLTPLLQQQTKAFNQFRMSGNKSDEPPTDQEKKDAGCKDDDSDEEVMRKVTAMRAKNDDQPMSRREVMQLFRKTGGNAVSASGKNESGTVVKDGTDPFYNRVTKYCEAGMKEGVAIMRAKADDAEGYNRWHSAGRPKTLKAKTNEE